MLDYPSQRVADALGVAPSRGAAVMTSGPTSGVGVVDELAAVSERLGCLPAASGDAERIDRIAALERLRGAVAAAQARETVEFAASQLAEQAAAGVPKSRLGRGIAEQVGLARRMSPASAARQVTLAEAWQRDLPAVFTALRRGETSEWAATIIARETTGLDRPTRRRIAEELAPELPEWSPRQVEAAARRMAYEADPRAVLARGRTARADRRVSLRPAPDTMAVLSAFLPAEQGVAAWAALDRQARTARATGDPRTLGQVMADTLVERVTGQPAADAISVEVGITMTADSLLGTDQTPAELDGYGPIPADLALDLIAHAADPSARTAAWVRRLFTDPVDDTVVGIDTRRRRFDGGLARLIRHRDRVCRDPYCTAPIRHLDHIVPHREGGTTTAENGAGLCERGNYTKDMPGWLRRTVTPAPASTGEATITRAASDLTGSAMTGTDPGKRSTAGGTRAPHLEIRTPTGHRYLSKPPPALGPGANHHERTRRATRRRIDYLYREQLIARLPSPANPADEPP